MSILIVGASHRTAPVDLLERLAVDTDGATKLRSAVLDSPHVTEALVLATCNRIEIYAEVDRFHGSVDDVTALLVDRAGSTTDEVLPSLYVHYDEAAVAHVFEVATGLDSMVVGESQILGQVREALRSGQADETVGTALNTLFQQALRVGKRAHSETGIDRAGQSVVSVALEHAADVIGALAGARVCIAGSGSVAALAASSLRRAGVTDIDICSRTMAHSERLAHRIGGRASAWEHLPALVAEADLVVSCTTAMATIISVETVADAMATRGAGSPLAIIDLALPHDVAPEVTQVPGVQLIALKTIAASVNDGSAVEDIANVRAIMTEEVVAFAAAREAARVAPTVVALRSMATAVVSSELERLWRRRDDLSPEQRDEIVHTVRRVADKLLHEPTVRIKQLAGRSPESSYVQALAELFALDQTAVEALTRAGEPS